MARSNWSPSNTGVDMGGLRPGPHAHEPPVVVTAPVSDKAIDYFHTLERRGLNFEPISWQDACADPRWRTDQSTRLLAAETPGDPDTQGPYQRAIEALEAYEFADPDIVRGVYDPTTPLDGRNMLLVGRFLHLRFHMGVRIGGVVDETATDEEDRPIRSFGWHYRTLEDHLEQGQMDYEIRKYLDSGEVEFRVRGYSRAAPIGNPVVRLGFALFGRRQQARFYRNIVDRMALIATDDRPAPPST